MARKNGLMIIFLLIALPSSSFAIENPKIGGYYKNLLTASETISNEKPYIFYLQRLRFDLSENFSDTLSARVVSDNNFLLNDFSKTADFNLVREDNQRELAFWDTHEVLVDKRDLFWTHSLYRAYIQYETPKVQCIIGKQNIDWSRMRFYHPFDLFNPVSPLSIEQDEKMGVDSVNFSYRPEPFMSYNFIYAPDKDEDLQSFGLLFSGKIRDYDIFLMGADIKKDFYTGFAFDGYFKESGLRGELTYTFVNNDQFGDNNADEDFMRCSLGLDRSFTPKLYGIVEYFYNGGAKMTNIPLFFTSIPFDRWSLSVTKHIVGGGLEYEFTGIIKFNNYLFYDVEGNSFYYNPEFKWNIKPNADLRIGCQVFEGEQDSEYGNYNSLFYAEMKLFF